MSSVPSPPRLPPYLSRQPARHPSNLTSLTSLISSTCYIFKTKGCAKRDTSRRVLRTRRVQGGAPVAAAVAARVLRSRSTAAVPLELLGLAERAPPWIDPAVLLALATSSPLSDDSSLRRLAGSGTLDGQKAQATREGLHRLKHRTEIVQDTAFDGKRRRPRKPWTHAAAAAIVGHGFEGFIWRISRSPSTRILVAGETAPTSGSYIRRSVATQRRHGNVALLDRAKRGEQASWVAPRTP